MCHFSANQDLIIRNLIKNKEFLIVALGSVLCLKEFILKMKN